MSVLAELKSRGTPTAPAIATSLLLLYAVFGTYGPRLAWVAGLALALVVAQLARAPRWVVYSILLMGFACTIAHDVFVDAVGPQDGSSDRDEAVEVACRALMHGRNPWLGKTPLGNPISTGPVSMLIALPFVVLFGRINELTLLFWIAVALCAVAGDLVRKRDASLVLLPLLQLGLFDVHTMRYWSLDELSFAVLLFVPAWRAALRARWVVAGVLVGCAVLCRTSYVFPALAFLCWLRWEQGATWRQVARTAIAAGATCVLVVIVLVALFSRSIAHANPVGIALDKAAWPIASDNALTSTLAWLSARVPPRLVGVVRSGLAALLVLAGARGLARVRTGTPFGYVALANLLAFTVVHYAGRFADNFTGPIVIAALLCVAFSTSPTRAST